MDQPRLADTTRQIPILAAGMSSNCQLALMLAVLLEPHLICQLPGKLETSGFFKSKTVTLQRVSLLLSAPSFL